MCLLLVLLLLSQLPHQLLLLLPQLRYLLLQDCYITMAAYCLLRGARQEACPAWLCVLC